MIRLSVLPYARSGIVSAVMLGLGRAMGETMAVAMVLSASGVVTFNLISSTNPSTIAANIALTFADATGLKVNALVATGLVLFVITFVVNFAARAIVVPRRQVGDPMTTTAPPPSARRQRPRARAAARTPGCPAGRRCSWPRWRPPRPACSTLSLGWGVVGWVFVAAVLYVVGLPAVVPCGREPARRHRPPGHHAGLGRPWWSRSSRWSRCSPRWSATAPPSSTSTFLNNSMRNVIGEGGGIYHALVGTLLITLGATVISVPIGLMTSIYLVEYGAPVPARVARSASWST